MNHYRIVEDITKKVIGTYPNFIPEVHFDINDTRRIGMKGVCVTVDEEVLVPPLALKRKNSKVTNMLPSLYGGFGMSLIVDDKLKTILESSKTSGFRYFATTLKMFNSQQTMPYWFIKPIRPFYEVLETDKCIFKEGVENFSDPDNRKVRKFKNVADLYNSLD